MEAKDRRVELESRFKTLYQMAESQIGFNSVLDPDHLDKASDADLKSEIQWLMNLLRTPH